MTLLVGVGARDARAEVLQLAETLQAPMVLTLKAKEGLEHDNRFQVGQSGLIGNPAAAQAMDDCDVLFLVGTDFPYRDWYPAGKTVVQLDARQAHIGRRTSVSHALVGDVGDTLRALLPRLGARTDSGHLDAATEKYAAWHDRQQALLDPGHDTTSSAGCARCSTTPTTGSAPRRWRRRSTGTPPRTPSSPPTPGCRPCGCRGS